MAKDSIHQTGWLLVGYILILTGQSVHAQRLTQIDYGNFEQWVTRHIKESAILGGETKTLWEIGPSTTLEKNQPYTNLGGSPWATSNVFAKVSGIAKGSVNVFPDTHNGGKCVKMTTHVDRCQAMGLVDIRVLAAGSVFLGKTLEPITSSKNPMSKISMGIPFTQRPKALMIDYKVELSSCANRLKVNGMGHEETVPGPDYGIALCLLQKRWEDSQGRIHALRVGTLIKLFTQTTTGWREDASFPIQYGDITHSAGYQRYMGLYTGDRVLYAENSKGKNVPIEEEGWADGEETPTHVILKFESSHGDAYIGSPGNTLWIDNVRFQFE